MTFLERLHIKREPPLVLQILFLLLGGLIVGQLVTLMLTLLLPPEPQSQYKLSDIAATLARADHKTQYARPLQRVVQSSPPSVSDLGWLVSERSRRDLAQLLQRDEDDVRLYFYTTLPFAGSVRTTGDRADAETGEAFAESDDAWSAPTASPPPPRGFMFASYQVAQAGPGGGMPGGSPGGSPFPSQGSMSGAGSPFPSTHSHMPPLPKTSSSSSAPSSETKPSPSSNGSSGSSPNATKKSDGSTSSSPKPASDTSAGNTQSPPPLSDASGTKQSPPEPEAKPAPNADYGGQQGTSPQEMPYDPHGDSRDMGTVRLPRSVAAPKSHANVREKPASAVRADTSVVGTSHTENEPAAEDVPAPTAPARSRHAAGGETSPAEASARGLFGLAPSPFVEGDFVAALHLQDGQWAVVKPQPEPFPNAWQRRVILWFLISFAIVAPLGWLFSRRVVRPLTGFAAAAEQLGRDPHAPILALDGPAEIGRAAYAFNRMQSRLRSFVDDRTAMIGAISHDLRTPLTRMRFRLEDADEDIRDGMLLEIDEMEEMIGSVLNFIRDASAPGVRERLDLLAIVEDVVEDAAFVGSDVLLERSESASVEVSVLGMRRVLGNLVENAVKYGMKARVSIFTDQNDAIVEIRDNGPGLPEGELERVFQPFYRSSNAVVSDKKGSGLGLAICRSIARAHGGDVRLQRMPDGLAAQLRIPLIYEAGHSMRFAVR